MATFRKASVMFKRELAGILEETASGYRFTYDRDFLGKGTAMALSFPLQERPFESDVLFPFFEGLLPEGWYREIVCQTLKIDKDDHFGLLLASCPDCIGAVWIQLMREDADQ